MKHHGLTDRNPRDFDCIATYNELQNFIKRIKSEKGIVISKPLSENKWVVKDCEGFHYEVEIAWKGSSGDVLMQLEGAVEGTEAMASKEALLALKMSHRYLRNSPHFLKTMRDIQSLRTQGVVMTAELEAWLPQREQETYVYNHPKLNVDKQTFFDDSVGYVYDHDSLHETVALGEKPAYTMYMQDGAQVMTDREKFFSVSEETRLHGVYEESCVLALERSQIPFNFEPDARRSFEMALMKVCTSITSGWFRQYAYDSYDKVLDLYNELGESNYIERFKKNAHLLKPFRNE